MNKTAPRADAPAGVALKLRNLLSCQAKPWQTYAFAIVATLATLAVRLALDDLLEGRPTLVMFTLPIILSAYIGGFRSGLLATALTYLVSSYYLLAPLHSLKIASSADRWPLFFLVLSGLVISMLNEALHRTRRRASSAVRELDHSHLAQQASEGRYRTLFEYAPDGIVIADNNSVYLDANPSLCRMLGYSRQEMIGLHASNIVIPAEIPHIGEALDTIHARSNYHRVWQFRRKDGTVVSAEVVASQMPDGNLMGVIRDITERQESESARKTAADALRQNDIQLQTIIQNISEAVVVSGLDGKLLHFNDAALKMLGYATMDEGRRYMSELASSHEVSDLDGTPWTVEQWPLSRILRGEILHDLEARMRRVENPWRQIYSFSGSIAHDADGKPLMAIITFNDITARKQAESAALLMAAIVESSADAVIGKDMNSLVTSWNQAAETMFGYTAAEMLGESIMRVIPEDRHDDEARFMATIKRGYRVEHFETQRMRRDGTLFSVSLTLSPIRDSHGRVIGVSKVVRDISERKAAEEALCKSEERFRLLVEGVHEYAIILLDADGNIVSWNAGAERVNGYKSEAIIGRCFSVFYMPEDQAAGKPAQELRQAVAQGRWEDEGWRVRADGSHFWASVLITALRDECGNIRGFSKLTRDITERKAAAEVLLKAGALQRAIFNSANFSSIATDAKGVIQIFNVGAERMLGYTAAEVMNKITPADISDPQEVIARAAALSLELQTNIAPGFEALVFKASREIEDIYELTYVRKDGTRFPAVVSVTALRDAQEAIIGYLLIGTDNTKRKEAEECLMRSQKEARIINNELSFYKYSLDEAAIVAATDYKGTISYVNDKFCQISGYTREELMGQNHRLLNSAYHPKSFFIEMYATIAKGNVWRGEIRNRAKDGHYFWMDTTIIPTRGSDGVHTRYVAIRADITERKNAEADLETHRMALELANNELAGKNTQLSELYQTAQRFMDDVSHEFRTPLSVIKGYSELMLAGIAGPQSTDQSRFSQIIIDRTSEMARMVDDLLDSSKLRDGSLRVNRKPCHVASIFAAVHPVIDSMAAASKTQWVEEIAPDLPQVFADAEKVTRIIVNLVINAMKFSPEASRIVLRAELDAAGDVRIEVTDQGCGISPENLAKIFQRFRQVGNNFGSAKGFGLGLNIAKELVSLNFGKMNVKSELKKGSTFSFTLPVNDPAIILTRLLENLNDVETPQGSFAILRVTPERPSSSREQLSDLCGYLASSSCPRDVIMPSDDGASILIFGYSGKPQIWLRRLVTAGREIEQFSPAQKLCRFEVKLVDTLYYPTPLAKVLDVVLTSLKTEPSYV